MQTAVLAMGIGEGGRAGIAIDDADAGETRGRRTCDCVWVCSYVRGGFPNLIVIPFSCEAAACRLREVTTYSGACEHRSTSTKYFAHAHVCWPAARGVVRGASLRP